MRPHPKGFSLIELLAAMAAMAILVGLLAVALPRVRAYSDRVAATASLRSIGLAIQHYSNEHTGQLPGPLYYSQNALYKKGVPGMLGYYLWSYLESPEPTSSWQTCEIINTPAFLRERPLDTSPLYIVQRNIYKPGQPTISPFGYPNKEQPISVNALMEFNLRDEWALQELDQQHPEVATWDKSNMVSQPLHGDVRMTVFFDWHVEGIPVED